MKYGKTPKRKRAARKDKTGKNRRGLRVSLKGLRTTAELRAMLHEAVDQLEASGITHMRGINLYLTPTDAKGNRVTRIGTDPIEDIEITHPYPSAAEEHGL